MILIVIVVFMAVTSSGSAELVAVSSLVSYDVYRTYINPKATGKQVRTTTRQACLHGHLPFWYLTHEQDLGSAPELLKGHACLSCWGGSNIIMLSTLYINVHQKLRPGICLPCPDVCTGAAYFPFHVVLLGITILRQFPGSR